MSVTDKMAELSAQARAPVSPCPPPLGDLPRREIALGLGVTGAFLVALFGWGVWAHLDAAATVSGQVEVAGSRQAVQHHDGGIVSELDVHEGDEVKAQQVLLRLNADELRAAEEADADQAIQLQAQQARLQAELAGARAIQIPAALTALTGHDAETAEAAMALQRREFNARSAALTTEQSVLAQKARESLEQIVGYQRELDANREQHRLVGQEVGGLNDLMARGLVPATRLRSLQRSAAELQGSEGEYEANIARTRQEIGEDRIRSADLQRQRSADDAKDFEAVAYQLSEIEPKLAAIREQLSRTEVRAPVAGRVVGLSIFTVGGVVSPGQVLMDVVPADQPLVIGARVSPTEVGDLHPGQQAEIRVSAFHDRGMPSLHGVIEKVSADSFTDERTGSPYFKIEVKVPVSELAKIRQRRGSDGGLKPGIPVELLVPLHARTALDYLVEPLRQVLWRSFRQP